MESPPFPENSDTPPACSRGRRFRVLTGAAVVLGALGILIVLEAAARWVMPIPASPLDQARHVITAAGLPALADLFEPDDQLFWRLRPNLQAVRVRGTLEGYPLDFTVSTDRCGRRITPRTEGQNIPTVWALGDSATFGLGVEDEDTWPAWLHRIAAAHDQPIQVFNYGTPGYTAWQGLRQLELLLTTDTAPDVLVAGFWANDQAVWAGRSDAETARWLASRSFPGSWIHRLALFRLLEPVFPDSPVQADRPRLNAAEFTACLDQMARLCREQHIVLALLVWPSRIQVLEHQRELHGYQRLVQNTAASSGCFLIDPAAAFMSRGTACFVDNYHGSALGCRLTGEVIWEWLSRILSSSMEKGKTPGR